MQREKTELLRGAHVKNNDRGPDPVVPVCVNVSNNASHSDSRHELQIAKRYRTHDVPKYKRARPNDGFKPQTTAH